MDEEDLLIYQSKVKIFFVGVIVGAVLVLLILGICSLVFKNAGDEQGSSEFTKESFSIPDFGKEDDSAANEVKGEQTTNEAGELETEAELQTDDSSSGFETEGKDNSGLVGSTNQTPKPNTNSNAGAAVNAGGSAVSGYKVEAGTPLANHGRLQVSGTNLVDKSGKVFQLRGVSTHGLQWFPQYVNKETFKAFRDEWSCNVIRLAMYTGEGGYCTGANQANLKSLIANGVNYATELGMYVIIDWHSLNDDRNPNTFKSQAISFWDEMSRTYKNHENVIYEICNEPNSTSWSEVRSYATDVLATIRKNDPNAIVLVGTPQWCQLPQDAAANRIANDKNVMYTVHFYAATHGDNIRNNVVAAHNAGLPMFVSECSICDASGGGGCNYDSANKWISLLDSYGISYVAWNISNKGESSALLRGDKKSGWTDGELSETGKWFKKTFTGGRTTTAVTQTPTQAPNPVTPVITPTQTPTQAPTQAPTPAPTQPAKQQVAANLSYSLDTGSGWQNGNSYVHQYTLTIKNNGDSEVTDWTITIPNAENYSIFGSWCCKITQEGNSWIIKPESYNNTMPIGGTVTGIGLQVNCPSEQQGLPTGTIKGIGLK